MIPGYLNQDVLCIDTETSVLGDHVCEVGFTLFRNCEPMSSWNSFIKPTIPIDPEATNVHHIKDTDVEDSPSFKDLSWFIYNHMNSADLWCMYNADYDIGVLKREFARLDMKLPKKYVVDPFILFKKYAKFNKGKKLINAAEKYGIQYVGAHRAGNDAAVTGRVLFKMAATRTDFPKTLNDYIKKQRKWCEEQFEDLQAYFLKVGKGPIDKPNYAFYEGIY